MNKVFIVDPYKNPALLRFTQTKIFFDAKNKSTDWAIDCETVESVDQINENSGIIINSNQFVTTNFRRKYRSVNTLIDARDDPDLIEFDPDYSYDLKKRPPYAQGSKQLYILENLYKVVLKSKKLVYLDNTEEYIPVKHYPDHFYGLASGWKSIRLVKDIGIDSLKTITIYDISERQLEYQKYLHSKEHLPDSVIIDPPVCGEYNRPNDLIEFWPTWHSADVKFELLDLFDTPTFPENSLVWISNIFRYEPTIFKLGWEECKSARDRLINQNQSCIILS